MKKLTLFAAAVLAALFTTTPAFGQLRQAKILRTPTAASVVGTSNIPTGNVIGNFAEDKDLLFLWNPSASLYLSSVAKTDKVSLTLAEMTALRATNKTLVAAQGANTIIVPISAVFFLNYGSAAFTESADNLALNYVGASGDVACTAFETTGSWLVASADSYGVYTCDTNLVATTAQAVNTALTLDNNGDGEFGGGTGSTVTVWITYRVLYVGS